MKILLKIIMVIVGLLAIFISIWYFYFWKKFSTLQEVDRQQIIESLMPDSDGKGYSDIAEIQIKQDMSKINSLNYEEKIFFEKWYRINLKIKRQLILSKNREEYLKKTVLYYKSNDCFSIYLGSIKEKFDFSFLNNIQEFEQFYDLFYKIQKKNFRFLSFDEIFDIQNPNMDFDKCNDLEKEIIFD